MRSVGIDIGSRAIKVVLSEHGSVVSQQIADTGTDPLLVCRRLLRDVKCDTTTATGYGRHLFKEHWPESDIISEIKAVSLGATAVLPGCRTIVDIGGQDTKAISLEANGRLHKFVMNDRCAAGTGQFLEMMATTLGYTHASFIKAAQQASRAVKLNSMCTVFAQSEVVSIIARGGSKPEIALGLHQSIASRTVALAGGVRVQDPVVFTGGCGLNPCLVALISAALKRQVLVPESPQTVAALGSALYGERKEQDLG